MSRKHDAQRSAPQSKTSDSEFDLDMMSSWHELETVAPASTAKSTSIRTPAVSPQSAAAQVARPAVVPAQAARPSASPKPAVVPQAAVLPVHPVASPVLPTPVARPIPPVYESVAPTPYIPPARPTYPAYPTQRRSSGQSLEALLPLIKWGAVVVLVVLGGFGVSRLLASSGTNLNVETLPVQIKVLVNNKPAPGASLTLTPVLTEEQSKAFEGDLSAAMQLIGKGKVGNDSTCSPSLSAEKAGLPAGEYIASLTWCKVQVKDGETIAGPDLIPEMFRTPSTSTLRVKVAADASSPITLQVMDPKLRAKVIKYDPE